MVALAPLLARLAALFASTRAFANLFHSLQTAAPAPGLARLHSSALYLLLLQLTPFLFPSAGVEIIARGGTFFLCNFLGTLRWVLWCIGRWPEGGPTAGLTVSQLQGLLFLPVEGTVIAAKGEVQHASLASVGLRLGVLAAVVVTLSSVNGATSTFDTLWRHSLYSLALYTLLTGFQDLAALFINGSLGLHAKIHFGNGKSEKVITCSSTSAAALCQCLVYMEGLWELEPLLSDRLTIFWGRKWNLPVQSLLRALVYDPIMEGQLIRPIPVSSKVKTPIMVGGARRSVAVCAVFVLSGFMHEAAFCYLTGAPSPQLRWMWFFVAQGPLCCLESAVFPRRAAAATASGASILRLSRIIATAVILELLAAPLFFKPVEDSGLASAIVHDAISSFSPRFSTA